MRAVRVRVRVRGFAAKRAHEGDQEVGLGTPEVRTGGRRVRTSQVLVVSSFARLGLGAKTGCFLIARAEGARQTRGAWFCSDFGALCPRTISAIIAEVLLRDASSNIIYPCRAYASSSIPSVTCFLLHATHVVCA